MIRYIVRRLLVLPVIMLIVSLVLFFLMWQLPAEQRVQIFLPSANPNMTPEQYAELVQRTIRRRGLDRPFPVAYAGWIGGLLRGEWGYSPVWRQDVLAGILRRMPASAEIAIVAMVPTILLALSLGSLSARRHRKLPDHLVQAATALAWAFPPFIMGLLLMNVFYAWLDWFPPERLSIWASPVVHEEGFRHVTGMYTVDALINGNLPLFWDALRHLGLPGLTLAVSQWALLTRLMRSSMLNVMREDFVTTARSKGLSERVVALVHVRGNAVLPLISTAGVTVSTMISTLIIVEIVFNFNGLGRSAATAILGSDVQVAVGFSVFTCMVVVLSSLAADVLYAVVDPRVRL